MNNPNKHLIRNIILFLLLAFPLGLQAQFRIEVQSGLAFSQYNDVRIPNGNQEKGTLFSLQDDFSPVAPTGFVRLELSYLLKDRHTFELTAAPLQLDYRNSVRDTINFAGSTFVGDQIDGRYEFNTYRFSYRYRIINKPKTTLDLGATVLMRDARIALSKEGKVAEDTDLGFVPLISFNFNYFPIEKLALTLKGDALVSTQGRAEDIFAGVTYTFIPERLDFKAGYRFIEGGSGGGQVYNFAYIHFVNLGFGYSFR